jgi:hypothetical protein
MDSDGTCDRKELCTSVHVDCDTSSTLNRTEPAGRRSRVRVPSCPLVGAVLVLSV